MTRKKAGMLCPKGAGNRGMAMILVLFAFVLILTMGILALTASDAALHTATDSVAQKQAEALTDSYAQTLAAQLGKPGSGLCDAAQALEDGGNLTVEGEFTSPDGAFTTEEMSAVCTRSADTLTCAVRCARNRSDYSLTIKLQLAELEGGKKAWQLLAYAPPAAE